MEVNSVTGLGLTWTQATSQCGGRSQTGVEVWSAIGIPTASGPVTATLAGTAHNTVIAVSRYSGVNVNVPIGNVVAANTLGIDGACSGGSDSSSYNVTLTGVTNGSIVYSAVGLRNRTHSEGVGYTERVYFNHGDVNGNKAGIAIQDQMISSSSGTVAVAVDGSFNNTVDWGVIGLEIKSSNEVGITYEESQSGVASNSSSVSSAPITAVNEHLYLAAISTKQFVEVDTVTGLGLTWTQATSQCGGRSQTGVEVWSAIGIPTASGPVTATLAGTAHNTVIAVSRYSGVSASAPVGSILSANSLGIGGACSGGSDSSSYNVTLTAVANGSIVYSAVGLRNRTHSEGDGYTERFELHHGAINGDRAGLATQDKLASSPHGPTDIPVDGTFSADVDWGIIAIELKPNSGGQAQGTQPITIQAEDMNLTPPMVMVEDGIAPGEHYIWVPPGGIGGEATTTVDISVEGDYHFWARGQGVVSNGNSFFVKVDDREDYAYNLMVDEDWQWNRLFWGEKIHLTVGTHTITVKQRDSKTKLDKLVITADETYLPPDIDDSEIPYIISPIPGTTLDSSTFELIWSEGAVNRVGYNIRVWKEPIGSIDNIYFDFLPTNVQSVLVKDNHADPDNVRHILVGEPLYVSLWFINEDDQVFSHEEYMYETVDLIPASPLPIEVSDPSLQVLADPMVDTVNRTGTFTWTTPSEGEATWYLLRMTQNPDLLDHWPWGYGDGDAGWGDREHLYRAGDTMSAVVDYYPLTGRPLYVELWYEVNGKWSFEKHTYPTSGLPLMQTPVPGQKLDSERVTFRWNEAPPEVKHYEIGVATNQRNLDDQVAENGYGDIHYEALPPGDFETTVENIPITGDPIYVRLWYLTEFNRYHWEDYIFGTLATIVHEEVQIGQSSALGSVTTSAPVTDVDDNLYLASVSTKPFVEVSSVSGLGLTWTRVDSQCGSRSATGVEVWSATGTPVSSDTVTATLAGTPNNAVIAVSRYSGVDVNDPIGNVIAANTSGVNGACSGGTDSSSYNVTLTSVGHGSLVYSAAGLRNRTHTEGAGYTQRAEFSHGNTEGAKAGIAVQDQLIDNPSGTFDVIVDGSFSGDVDWAVIGIEIHALNSGNTPNIPSAATAVNRDRKSPYSVDVSWNAVTTYVDGTLISAPVSYNVYRGTSSTDLQLLAESITGTVYSDTIALQGEQFVYAVSAVVSNIESAHQTAYNYSTGILDQSFMVGDGMWVWNNTLYKNTNGEADELIVFCQENGIENIAYHVGAATDLNFNDANDVAALESFIAAMSAANIRVEALLGDPSWTAEFRHEGLQILHTIIDYQYNHRLIEDQRFEAIHLNVEPHLLPEYQTGVVNTDSRRDIYTDYLDMLDEFRAVINSKDWTDADRRPVFASDLPTFYDNHFVADQSQSEDYTLVTLSGEDTFALIDSDGDGTDEYPSWKAIIDRLDHISFTSYFDNSAQLFNSVKTELNYLNKPENTGKTFTVGHLFNDRTPGFEFETFREEAYEVYQQVHDNVASILQDMNTSGNLSGFRFHDHDNFKYYVDSVLPVANDFPFVAVHGVESVQTQLPYNSLQSTVNVRLTILVDPDYDEVRVVVMGPGYHPLGVDLTGEEIEPQISLLSSENPANALSLDLALAPETEYAFRIHGCYECTQTDRNFTFNTAFVRRHFTTPSVDNQITLTMQLEKPFDALNNPSKDEKNWAYTNGVIELHLPNTSFMEPAVYRVRVVQGSEETIHELSPSLFFLDRTIYLINLTSGSTNLHLEKLVGSLWNLVQEVLGVIVNDTQNNRGHIFTIDFIIILE